MYIRDSSLAVGVCQSSTQKVKNLARRHHLVAESSVLLPKTFSCLAWVGTSRVLLLERQVCLAAFVWQW